MTNSVSPPTPLAEPRPRPGSRLKAARATILTAAVAFGGAVALDDLDPWYAVCGLVLVAVAAVLAHPLPRHAPVVRPDRPQPVPDGRLVQLVLALPEPALLVDRRGTVLAANPRVEASVGAPRIGEPLSFSLRVPEVLEAVRAVAAAGPARRVEFQAHVPVDRWFEAHVAPVRFGEGVGTPPGPPDVVLVLLRDLTQQRRLEQMRADFVANASHELRTPLASLSGFIETLQGPARNDVVARERFLAIMAEQAKRMSRLIDDLLSLSRIEMNLHIRPRTEVDLVHLAREVIDALGPLARERATELRLIEQADRLPVPGARDELIRVLENLVENALKYGATEAGIDVVCRRGTASDGRPEAVVAVIDRGPGIAPEHLPRLTERFYRVDVTRSREQGGTGLGLAIVKHILNRHRARLSIVSEVGRGSTFEIHLDVMKPLRPEEKTEA